LQSWLRQCWWQSWCKRGPAPGGMQRGCLCRLGPWLAGCRPSSARQARRQQPPDGGRFGQLPPASARPPLARPGRSAAAPPGPAAPPRPRTSLRWLRPAARRSTAAAEPPAAQTAALGCHLSGGTPRCSPPADGRPA
jgi:hypothetical protein